MTAATSGPIAIPDLLMNASRSLSGLSDTYILCLKIKDSVVGYEVSLMHAKSVRDKNVKRLAKLASNATATRSFGSAALTLCYLAKGVIDTYHVEDLQPWDIAAGAVIIREAGGHIVNSDGTEFNIMKPNLTAASSHELLKDVAELIKQANATTEYSFE